MKNLKAYLSIYTVMFFFETSDIYAQTPNEFFQYHQALGDLDKAKRLTTNGRKLNATPNRSSIVSDFGRGTIKDNSLQRAIGYDIADQGDLLRRKAEKVIERFTKKNEYVKSFILNFASFRNYTNNSNKVINASLYRLSGDEVTVVTKDQKLYAFDINNLKENDRDFVIQNSVPKFEWEPFVEFNGNIFPVVALNDVNWKEEKEFVYIEKPTFDISDYNILDPSKNGLIGIRFKGINGNIVDPMDIKIHIKGEYIKSGMFSSRLEIIEDDTFRVNEYVIYPTIIWDKEKLKRLRKVQQINILIEMTINGKVFKNSVQCKLRAFNDCVWEAPGPLNGGVRVYNQYFASYVDETSKTIDFIKSEILKSGKINSFNNHLLKEAEVVWDYLKSEGYKYSNQTKTGAKTKGIKSQTIRRFKDSFDLKQANCADGSVLFCSIMENLGYNTYLQLTPNHVYMGIYTFKNNEVQHNIILETTMISSATFDEACKAGNKNLLDNILSVLKLNKAKYYGVISGREHAEYVSGFETVKIKEARNLGIIPL
jgi:hypothetical protein